jgi:hypothetical protein
MKELLTVKVVRRAEEAPPAKADAVSAKSGNEAENTKEGEQKNDD